MAEGLGRKSVVTIVVFGALCTVVGAAVGSGAGNLGNSLFKSWGEDQSLDDLSLAIRVYVTVLGLIGGGVGLASGVLLGRRVPTAVNCVVGGVLAGVGAGLAYPVICALALPAATTDVLIPVGTIDLLLWCCMTTGLIGLVIPALAGKQKKKRKTQDA